jgi:hypothetical protein
MLPDDPRHGSHAGYIAGCRDDCCRRAKRRADKRRRLRALHQPLVVAAERARQHLDYLARWHVPYAAYGPHSTKASRIARGETTKLHATSEAAILAVTPEPGVNCFPAHGITRRLQALTALGWSQQAICDATGLQPPYVSMLVNNARGQDVVAPHIWRRVAGAYDRMSRTTGGAVRAERRARRNGWVPPAAWLDIDDPDETPDPGYQPPRRRDWLALVEDWAACGWDRPAVAAALGITIRSLERRCDRAGRRDLWRKLSKEAA